jgi:hypothetical protein
MGVATFPPMARLIAGLMVVGVAVLAVLAVLGSVSLGRAFPIAVLVLVVGLHLSGLPGPVASE